MDAEDGTDPDATTRSEPDASEPTAGFRHARPGFPVGVLAVIAAGGVVGAAGRYAIAEALPHGVDEFPTATFITNVAGSFLLGFVVVLTLERLPPGRYLRPFLATGALGAFTTFSTFAVESVLLVDHARVPVAALYIAATLVAGLAAAWVGITTAHAVADQGVRR